MSLFSLADLKTMRSQAFTRQPGYLSSTFAQNFAARGEAMALAGTGASPELARRRAAGEVYDWLSARTGREVNALRTEAAQALTLSQQEQRAGALDPAPTVDWYDDSVARRALSDYLAQNPDAASEAPDIDSRALEISRETEERAMEIAARASVWGDVGGLAGDLVGGVLSPEVILTAPIGVTRVGAVGLTAVGRVMAREAALASAIEAPVQALSVQPYRADAGLDAGFWQGVTIVATVGVGSAALTGLVRGVVETRNFFRAKGDPVAEAARARFGELSPEAKASIERSWNDLAAVENVVTREFETNAKFREALKPEERAAIELAIAERRAVNLFDVRTAADRQAVREAVNASMEAAKTETPLTRAETADLPPLRDDALPSVTQRAIDASLEDAADIVSPEQMEGLRAAVARAEAEKARRAAETPATPEVEQPVAPAAPKLPKALAGAKPRYQKARTEFESDIDRALFITAQPRKSKSDGAYRDWLRSQGLTNAEIDARGQQIRAAMRSIPAEDGVMRVPAQTYRGAVSDEVKQARAKRKQDPEESVRTRPGNISPQKREEAAAARAETEEAARMPADQPAKEAEATIRREAARPEPESRPAEVDEPATDPAPVIRDDSEILQPKPEVLEQPGEAPLAAVKSDRSVGYYERKVDDVLERGAGVLPPHRVTLLSEALDAYRAGRAEELADTGPMSRAVRAARNEARKETLREQLKRAEKDIADAASRTAEPQAKPEPFPETEPTSAVQGVAKHLSGEIVWASGDYAIVRGFNTWNGGAIYVPVRGSRYITGGFLGSRSEFMNAQTLLPREVASHMHDVMERIRAEDAARVSDDPFKDGGQVVGYGNVDPRYVGFLGRLAEITGEKTRIVLVDVDEARSFTNLWGDYYGIRGMKTASTTEGSSLVLPNGAHALAISTKAKPVETLETLSHEFGHLLQRSTFNSAPPEIRAAIVAEWKSWRTTALQGTRAELVQSMRASQVAKRTIRTSSGVDQSVANVSPYWTSFSEWFADQVARWATTEAKPLTIIEEFFSRLGARLRKLYEFFGRQAGRPTPTMRDWLNDLRPLPEPTAPPRVDNTVVVDDRIQTMTSVVEELDRIDAWQSALRDLEAAKVSPEALRALDTAFQQYRRAFPNESQERIIKRLQHDMEKARGRRALQVATTRQAQSAIQEFAQRSRDLAVARAKAGTKPEELQRIGDRAAAQAMLHVISADRTGRFRFNNFEAARDTYRGKLHSLMSDAIQDLSPAWWQKQSNRAEVDAVGRALFGATDQSDNAKALAAGIRATLDAVPNYFRRFGVDIGYVKNFLPTMHEPALVQKASFAEWAEFIKERTDWANQIDRQTGEPFTEEAYDEVLSKVYDKIRTQGVDVFNAADPSSRKFVDRLEKDRFFRWRDYEGWKEYQERFGNGGNLMGVVAHYINSSSRDLAIVQTLGIDPEGSIRMIENTLRANSGQKYAVKVAYDVRQQWAYIKGELAVPVDHRIALAEEVMSTTVRMADLGFSTITSLTDLVFSGTTRHFYGVATRTGLAEYIRNFGTMAFHRRSPEARDLLKGGMGGEAYLSSLRGASAALGDHVSTRVLHRMNDGFFKFNGLQPHTEAIRVSAATSTLETLRRIAPGGMDKAPKQLAEAMQAYGIDDALLRKLADPAVHSTFRGVEMVNLPKVFEVLSPTDAAKVMAVVNDVRYAASPHPNVNTRAWLHGQAGTAGSFLKRLAFMYTSYPIVAYQTQLLRTLYSSAAMRTKVGLIGANILLGTMVGVFVLQARQLSQGKDPMSFEDPELYIRAFLLSGMFGPAADFLARDVNAWRNPSALAGPIGSRIADIGQLVAIPATAALTDDEVNPGRELADVLRSFAPGQNLPGFGLVMNRNLLDNLQAILDPEADRLYRNRARNLRRRTGQEYYWPQGEMAPYRAPELTE